SAESYVGKAAELYGQNTAMERLKTNTSLYAFLASYRISPSSWGFGEPNGPSGYSTSPKWWLDSAENMVREVGAGPGFATMRLPISNNRASAANDIAGLSPA